MHKRGRPEPSAVDDAPAESLESAARAIVGFELEIARLEGMWKLGQHRPVEDRAGVRAGLLCGTEAERMLAELIPE